MNEPLLPIAGTNSICSACGAAFHCGLTAGDKRCWCFDLPRLLPMSAESSSSCLCEACLRAEIARRTSSAEPPC